MNKQSSSLKPRLFALAMLVVIATSAPAFEDSGRLSGFVESGMELWQVPGMAVSVVSGSEVLFQKSFGTTALRDGSKIDQHTQFAIASTTKAMVVTGILLLADQGKLSLDDPHRQTHS